MKPQNPESFPCTQLRGRGQGEGAFDPSHPWKILGRTVFLIWMLAAGAAAAPQSDSSQQPEPPIVGESRTIESLFLSGSQLQARPLTDDRWPIMVRIVNAFPQGTLGYRYDLVYSGYEAGTFDLRDFLQRVDGSPVADLPAIPVRIRSLLPPGQVEPNALPEKGLPRLGGYRWWMIVAVIFWGWVLAALLLVGWRKKKTATELAAQVSLADLLRPRIQAAMDNKLDARQYAELERMLIAMWQGKLKLSAVDPSAVVSQIRQHSESGPLMRQLERWMHDPSRDDSVDLTKLLEPLSRMPAKDFQLPTVSVATRAVAESGGEGRVE